MAVLKEIPRLDRTELRDLARDVVTGRVYVAVGENVEITSWPILALADLSEYDLSKIGGVYEEISKASPMAVNGRPIFFSCKFIHVDDLDPLREIVEQMEVSLR